MMDTAQAPTWEQHWEIARLARHTERLEQASNQLFAPLALLLMWRTLHAFALERWRP